MTEWYCETIRIVRYIQSWKKLNGVKLNIIRAIQSTTHNIPQAGSTMRWLSIWLEMSITQHKVKEIHSEMNIFHFQSFSIIFNHFHKIKPKHEKLIHFCNIGLLTQKVLIIRSDWSIIPFLTCIPIFNSKHPLSSRKHPKKALPNSYPLCFVPSRLESQLGAWTDQIEYYPPHRRPFQTTPLSLPTLTPPLHRSLHHRDRLQHTHPDKVTTNPSLPHYQLFHQSHLASPCHNW